MGRSASASSERPVSSSSVAVSQDVAGPPRTLPKAAAPVERSGQPGQRSVGGSGTERRTWVADPGCKIVACIEIAVADEVPAGSVHSDVLLDLAIRRLERCIRPGDWLCLLGGNRVAVHFGNGGHRVPPSVLGSRLARAMGDHLSIGADGVDVRVAIGISAGPGDLDATELTASAIAAVQSAFRNVVDDPENPETRTTVVVTHVPAQTLTAPRRMPADYVERALDESAEPDGDAGVLVHRIVRRVRVPLLQATTASDTSGVPQFDSMRQAVGTVPRVLIVDPAAPAGDSPRLAVEAVAAITRQLGARPTISPSSDADRLLLDIYVSEPHVVVVVLQGDTCRPALNGGPRRWESLSRLVRTLTTAGTPVIALAVGATAAAVAACMEQGAIGLLDPDDLPSELTVLVTASALRARNGGNGDSPGELSGRRLPAPFSALVGLTPSERKVLFHMMEGLSAAEIAESLVVSLPTVRSHIRSILRKLNVNSQLAAVAIANGTVRESSALA